MTISSNPGFNDYDCNGVTTAFPFTFKVFAEGDLRVFLRNTDTGAKTDLVLNTHYTVSGAGNGAGGTVTTLTTYDTPYTLHIRDNQTVEQQTDLRNQTRYSADTVESELDRLAMIQREQQKVLDRCIKVADGDTSGASVEMEYPDGGLASKVLAFDASGNASPSATVAEGILVSSAMEPVVGAASLSAARSAMGPWTDISAMGAVNVQDPTYGAVGDGVADDTAAINAAIAKACSLPYAERTVVFPPGTYNVSKIDVTDLDYLRLYAEGTVSIVGIDDSAGFIIGSTNFNPGSPWLSTVTRNFSMDGGTWLVGPAVGESYAHGMRLEHFVSGSFNRVLVSGSYATVTQGGLVSKKAAVYMQYSYVNSFNECSFQSPGTGVSNYAVFMDYNNCNLNIFKRCRLAGSYHADQIGFGIKGNGNSLVSCDISALGVAIDYTASFGLTVIGCYFEANQMTATVGAGPGIASSAHFIGGYCEVMTNGYGFNVGIGGGSRGTTIEGVFFNGESGGSNRTAVDLSVNAVGFRMVGCTYGQGANAIDTITTGTFNGNGGLTALDIVPATWVAFNNTQTPSTDPNTLDDYKEGTWTPVGNGITLASASGKYTKIGNVVHLFFEIVFPTTADAGGAFVTGVPFSAGASSRNGAAFGLTTDGSSTAVVVNQQLQFYSFAGALRTNAQCSTMQYYGTITYSV
jgi:hypothetical protein